MALDHNVDLNADRLDPQISDTRVAAASAQFRPTFNTGLNRNNQICAAVELPDSRRRRRATPSRRARASASGCRGTARPTTSRGTPCTPTATASCSSYDPLVTSGLTLGVSQPLVRDLSIDAARQNLITSRINRDIADTRLRESIVHTTANTKSAYWALVSALANVDARTSTLDLVAGAGAGQQGQGGRRAVAAARSRLGAGRGGRQRGAADHRADAGPPGRRSPAPAHLRSHRSRASGIVKIEPIDSPPIAQVSLDVDAAVTAGARATAPTSRVRRRTSRTPDASVKYADEPEAAGRASERQLRRRSGLGGTQVLRTGGFPGTIVGAGRRSPISDRC